MYISYILLSCSVTALLCVTDVWEEGNCQLVRFEPPPGQVTPDEELLATTYPLPQPSTFHLTQVVSSVPVPLPPSVHAAVGIVSEQGELPGVAVID
jgi:hypothetical protein